MWFQFQSHKPIVQGLGPGEELPDCYVIEFARLATISESQSEGAGAREMEQDVARQLFAEGAVLVLLDVPEGTEFGIDYNSWNIAPKFMGIKMIPPGFHFIFYRLATEKYLTRQLLGGQFWGSSGKNGTAKFSTIEDTETLTLSD